MGRIVVSLLVMSWFASHWTALQTERGPAAPTEAIHACSLLTKELVTQHTPLSKQSFDLVIQIPPSEDGVGQSGSQCTYGGVTLTIDAFTPEYFEKVRTPAWVPVPGVGDTAYFRDNGGRLAELYVRTNAHGLGIQMDVPTGRTSASIQPNAIALAKAILPKLK
jgi:hypothetical protein